MDRHPAPYLSYLLRLWWEDGWEGGRPACAEGEWRASLQDPHTQEMRVFDDLKALFDFLSKETKQRASTENPHSPNSACGAR
jgi:hypothetical protein